MDTKYIALTFDDGPREPMAEMVKKFTDIGGKGTFLLIGEKIDDQTEPMIRYAIEMGCELGGHSQRHISLNTLDDPDEIESMLLGPVKALKERFDYDVKLSRLPNHATNELVFEVARRINMPLIGTSVHAACDWDNKVPAEDIAEAVISTAYDGGICCMHVNERTCKALDTILPNLTERGFKLVTVSELFEIKGVTPPFDVQIKGV